MSDVDVKIAIEVVDAAAKRALGDLSSSADTFGKQTEAASAKANRALTLVTKESKNLTASAGEATGSFGSLAQMVTDRLGRDGSAAVGGISKLLSVELIAAAGLASIAVGYLGAQLATTLKAERNEQISNSFNAIAASAGLAGDSLRNGLLAASNGLADDEDILQAANRAIIQLGSNAEIIPRTMDIARKATALFGGDLIQNFEKINDAMATGNTRLLKQFGIVIDTDVAYKSYAKSIGSTADRLSDAGQKQAVMNAALETAAVKFKDVDEGSTKATQAFTRFKVSLGELGDTIAKTSSKSGFFASIFSALSSAVDQTSNYLTQKFGTGVDSLDAKLKSAKQNVEYYTASLAELQGRLSSATGTEKEGLAEAVEVARQKITLAKIEADDLTKAIGRLATANPSLAQNSDKPKQVKDPEKDAFGKSLADQAKNLEVQGQMRQEILAAQRQLELITEKEFQDAKFQLALDTYQKEQEALTAARAAGKLTETEYTLAKKQLADKFSVEDAKRTADAYKSHQKTRDEEIEAEKKLQAAKVSAVSQTFGNLATLMQTSSRELFAIGKAASLAQATINTYEAITKTMATVPYPFNIPLAAAQGVAGAVQVANIASMQPKFANGGIVPGSSYSGDMVQARVNSGEMILNHSQQAQLFKIANGGGSDARLDQAIALMSAVLAQPVSIQIDGKEIINVTRSQLASGRSFS